MIFNLIFAKLMFHHRFANATHFEDVNLISRRWRARETNQMAFLYCMCFDTLQWASSWLEQ